MLGKKITDFFPLLPLLPVGEFRHLMRGSGVFCFLLNGGLKHTDTIFYMVRQIAYIHGRESILFIDRERIQ